MQAKQLPTVSVFNQYTEEGKTTRCIVIDKEGKPTPIIGIDTDILTSIQMFNPSAGDVLLKCDNVEKKLEVLKAGEIAEDSSIQSFVEQSCYDFVNVFLHFEFPDNGYFIIAGFNDNIYGYSLEESFQRREQLKDLFTGLNPQLTKMFVNWIDKCNPSNFSELRWDADIDNLSSLQGTINPKQTCKVDRKADPVIYQKFVSFIVWYDEPNEEGDMADYVAVRKNVKDILESNLDGGFEIFEVLHVNDNIEKVIQIVQVNDTLTDIKLYSRNGLPTGAIPVIRYKHLVKRGCSDVEHINKLLHTFGYIPNYDETQVNEIHFSYNKAFDVTNKKLCSPGYSYLRTNYLNDTGRVLSYDLSKEEPNEEDFYTKPHIHVFSGIDYNGEEFVFVNCSKLFTETKKE